MTIQQEDDEEDEDVLIYVATYTHIYTNYLSTEGRKRQVSTC